MSGVLAPTSVTVDGWTYSLDVVQQPQRARMCGFGDKDRRPISPPPCIRLLVIDAATGQEVGCERLDFKFFVCSVDLWSADGTKEVNQVRHASSSNSSAIAHTYASAERGTPAYAPILPSNRDPHLSGYVATHPYVSQPPPSSPYPMHPYHPGNPPPHPSQAYGSMPPPLGYGAHHHMYGPPPSHGGYYGTAECLPPPPRHIPPPHDPMPYPYPSATPPPPQAQLPPSPLPPPSHLYDRPTPPSLPPPSQPQGMFTRNLIGSLASSAFELTDIRDRPGIWFVMQDLSVRTEGTFRLRFSIVNLAPQPSPHGQSVIPGAPTRINQSRAPILASCFSETFHVYSAKKFPGVCDSTSLSKCFAAQGIKIPIRKEGGSAKQRDEEEDY